MNTCLNHVKDWLPLALQANWSVGKLAKLCGVSVRTLERHFVAQLGKSPKVWLSGQRQKQAIELLREGYSVKEISVRIGYKHAHHFSRGFKAHMGVCPTDARFCHTNL